MHRLAATVRLDLRLQMRNGFYYAVAFVLVCWFIVLTLLPPIDWGYLLPAVVFGNLVMVNFYFVAGLVLLEKGEGDAGGPGGDAAGRLGVPGLEDTDAGRPLGGRAGGHRLVGVRRRLRGRPADRRHRAGGRPLHVDRLSLLVARYRSINEFMFPSVLFTTVLSLPMLHYFGLWDTWLLYLHPFTAPLVLLGGAFRPLGPWQWIYGVLYSAAWAGLLLLARPAGVRPVHRRPGGKRQRRR